MPCISLRISEEVPRNSQLCLIVEVVGLIGVACFLTVALLRDRAVFEGPKDEETTGDIPMVVTTIYCPEWRTNADVALGLVGSDSQKHIGVLTCDLLREGETCDRPGVGALATA